MSIENDLNRIATALEGLLAYATGTEAPVKRAGRPKRVETVDPAPPVVGSEPVVETAPANPAVSDAKPAAEMATVQPPASTSPAPVTNNVSSIVSVADLQKAVGVKVGQGKRDGVLALITGAGATKASDVPETKRAEVLAAINAL